MSKLSDIIFSPLQIKSLRSRLIFFLKQHFFAEFNFEIPIGQNLIAPITYYDSYDSFSEIFLQNEYDFLLKKIPLPSKWIDIGCNNGYFSLWMERELRKDKSLGQECYLIDADTKSNHSVKQLINRNRLNHFHYTNAAIGKSETITFYERPYMASSAFSSNDGKQITIPVLKSEQLKASHYDLLKVDIEGSEWELLTHYQSLLEKCKYIVMEWHSWHNGGGGESQIKGKLQSLGFQIDFSSPVVPSIDRIGSVGLILAVKNKS